MNGGCQPLLHWVPPTAKTCGPVQLVGQQGFKSAGRTNRSFPTIDLLAVRLDSFLNPWTCLGKIFRAHHHRSERNLCVECEEPRFCESWYLRRVLHVEND